MWIVSWVSDRILDLFPSKGSAEASAADEIRFLIESGRKEGVLDQTESEILGNVFRLDNRRVGAIMTPATGIAYLDLTLPREANMKVLQERAVSRFLVCKGGLGTPLGFVEGRELLQALLRDGSLDFGKLSPNAPFYVPNSLSLIGLLEFFKANQNPDRPGGKRIRRHRGPGDTLRPHGHRGGRRPLRRRRGAHGPAAQRRQLAAGRPAAHTTN